MPASDIGDFIVAAPDSPTLRTPFQPGVYNAGSTDAQAAIQNAIDDLPPAGGTIRILAGNYELKRATGQPYCIAFDRSNVRIMFDAGAILKLADSQFSNERGDIFLVGTSGSATLRENIVFWGPGIINGNRANQTLPASPAMAGLFFEGRQEDVIMGGGLQLINAGGAGLRTSAAGGQNHRRFRIDDLRMLGCNEGYLGSGVIGFHIDRLLIEDCVAQDAWEPLGCADVVMTNSIFRNNFGSAVDLASNQTSTQNTRHSYTNCLFLGGTGGVDGGKLVEIQVQPGGSDTEEIVFSSCVFQMQRYAQGLKISGLSATARAQRITLANCIFDGTNSTANSNGIEIGDDAQDININNCQVHNCGDNGMTIHGATRRPTRITVRGGSYFNNDQDAQGGSGIHVGEADDVFISGPHCYDNQSTPTQEHGVDLNDVANGLAIEVHNVHCKNNVTTGVRAGAGDGVSATDNYGQA